MYKAYVNGEVQIPLEATLFFLDTSMLILYKNDRNVRFVLFTKTSMINVHICTV